MTATDNAFALMERWIPLPDDVLLWLDEFKSLMMEHYE